MAGVLSEAQVTAFLERMGYPIPAGGVGAIRPTAETLNALHLAHRRTVPYENLDVWRRRSMSHEPEGLFEKVVRRRRGGWCHELNRLFAYLLQALGFRVGYRSASVHLVTGEITPDFSHLVLVVEVDEARDGNGTGAGVSAENAAPERWLADVGFGARGPLTALRLDDPNPQESAGDLYLVGPEKNGRRFLFGQWQDGWAPLYSFSVAARTLAEFDPRCAAQQGEPGWTERRMATIATERGRVSLDGLRLITTTRAGSAAQREERLLEDGEEWYAAVREHFGIDLERA